MKYSVLRLFFMLPRRLHLSGKISDCSFNISFLSYSLIEGNQSLEPSICLFYHYIAVPVGGSSYRSEEYANIQRENLGLSKSPNNDSTP